MPSKGTNYSLKNQQNFKTSSEMRYFFLIESSRNGFYILALENLWCVWYFVWNVLKLWGLERCEWRNESIVMTAYHQISNIRCTNYLNWIASHLVLQLSLLHALKPGVKSRMKMWLEHHLSVLIQLHLSNRHVLHLISEIWQYLDFVLLFFFSCGSFDV